MRTILILLITLSFTGYGQTAIDYFNSGDAKCGLLDYKGAIADYTKAIELKPDFADAYYNRGQAKRNSLDYKGAIADYTEAIELDPNGADAYYNRGATKYKLQDKKGACLDWSKAGELGEVKAYDKIKLYCN